MKESIIGKQFGMLIPIRISSQAVQGQTFYLCKCTRCGSFINDVYERDILEYKVRCCNNCNKKDFIGMVFGKLTVVEKSERRSGNNAIWWCKCSCDGKIVEVIQSNLLRSHTVSCGCVHKQVTKLANSKDITGMKFGRLTAMYPTDERAGSHVKWRCLCDCGSEVSVAIDKLISGHTKSCGCYLSDKVSADLTGRVFGKLTAIEPTEKRSSSGSVIWKCRCSCDGKFVYIPAHSLLTGHTQSCGCYKPSKKYFTDKEISLHEIYHGMIKRCYSKKYPAYVDYGARGITVCDEWRDKETGESAFINWAIANGYKCGLTVERMNKGIYHKYQNGPYAPWNCKIATRREQANNKRNNIYITVLDITHTLPDWSRLIGCDIKTARALYRSDPEKLRRLIAEKIML